jgi:hypothetical protein
MKPGGITSQPTPLGKCDSEQARAKQDKTGNGHSQETVRSEFFTHGAPPSARESDCQQGRLHTFAIGGHRRFTPALEADVGSPSVDAIKFYFRKSTSGGRCRSLSET